MTPRTRAVLLAAAVAVAAVLLWAGGPAWALSVPDVQIRVGEGSSPERISTALQILILLTVLSLAPAILIMMTSFVRIVVVLSFLRQAIGTHQVPPNQVVIGLALFLTFFIMTPVWHQVDRDALEPYVEHRLSQQEALHKALAPIRRFLFAQTREKDLALCLRLAKADKPRGPEDVGTVVLITAFMMSELKTAFQIGFLIYIPFLVLDMVIASILLSMGMMMLPPVIISLPFKLMLFVLVDGWYLVVGSLVQSFGTF